MEKTLSKSLQVKSVDNGAIITFDMSDIAKIIKGKKVKQAVIKLKTVYLSKFINGGAEEIEYKIYFDNPLKGLEIIDCFKKAGENGLICTDITDELIDAIKFKFEAFNVKIEGFCDKVCNDVENKVIITYENSRKSSKDNPYQNFDAKKAGSGKLNLFCGNYIFSHIDTNSSEVMPINVSHVFNSCLAGLEGDKISSKEFCEQFNSYNVGKGWKLNYQQYIVKNKPNDILLEDKETAGLFTYISADGSIEEFKEKFYYYSGDQKIYIEPNKVHIGQDGKLTFVDDLGAMFDVQTNIETDSGLLFQAELEGFDGLKLIQTEIDDIDSKRMELNSIRQTIAECEQNINQYKYSLNQIGDLENSEAKNYNATLKSLNLQIESLLTEKKALNDELNLKDRQFDNNNKFKNYNLEACGKEEGELKTRHVEYLDSTYELQRLSLSNVYDSDGTLSKKISLNNSNLELLEKNLAQTKNDLKFQQTNLQRSLDNLNNRKTEYEIIEQRKSFELKNLEAQVPTCIISNPNGNLLGFGKTKDENVYRLVLVADNYENAILIKYNEQGKIIRIENTEDKSVDLSYNENGLLSEITDCKNRKTTYTYDENQNLTEINYHSGKSSRYAYSQSGLLTFAVSPSGFGVKLDYQNNELIKISQISAVLNIKDNDISEIIQGEFECFGKIYSDISSIDIEYYDYNLATITDTKTDKKVTYLFDANGKPTTVYENKFENGTIVGNVKVRSFDRDGNKKAFSIEPKLGAKDLMAKAEIKGADKVTLSESYLSENTICGILQYATETVVPITTDTVQELAENISGKNMLECSLSDDMVSEINLNNATDYMLMCWAKADSAWAKRRLTDYCKSGTCKDTFSQSELDKLIIESADEFKLSRRFELRAEIAYEDKLSHEITRTNEYFCSYDHNCEMWQYLALPVTFNAHKNEQVKSVKAIFDYSYNTGKAQVFGMKFKEGIWEYKEFDNYGNTIYSENSQSDTISTYDYDNNNLLRLETHLKGDKSYQTHYYYNKNKSLCKTVDYNGVVQENVYNDKGQVIKSFTYHKSEPTVKLYSTETNLNEKGIETNTLNELGEKVYENQYDTHGNLSQTQDHNGEVVAYGYNDSGTLLQSTATVDGEVNSNTFGYTDEFLTKLSHNGFDYNYEYDGNGRQTKAMVAGVDYVSCAYKEVVSDKTYDDGSVKKVVTGEVQTKTYASGDITQTTLDESGNIKLVKFNDMPVLENYYDLNGRLLRSTEITYSGDASAAVKNDYNYAYDDQGRQTELSYVQDKKEVTINNTFDKNGNVNSSSFKLGDETLSTIYNYSNELQPKLNSLVLSNGNKQQISYDKLGRVIGTNIDNNFIKSYSYAQKGDHSSNMISAENFNINGKHEIIKYAYDKKGNITRVYYNGSLVCAYQYDSLNRLIREDNKPLNSTVLYGYDAGGNISYKIRHNFSLSIKNSLESEFDTKYTYSTSGWKDQLVRYNDEIFEHDQLGNPVVYRNKNLYWNRLRNLINYNNEVSFEYNFNGIRTGKISNGVTTKYYINGSKILAQSNGNMLYFHYGVEGVLGFTFKGVGNFNYIKNIFGDIVGILDSANKIIVKYVYDAWGNHKTLILSESGKYVTLSKEETYTDIEQNYKIIAEINPFRYRGYYYDIETGLYYLNSRYYDPEVGRFINADDISILNQGKELLNGLNLYSYCGNNPVSRVDETGCAWWHWLIGGLVIAAALVATIATGGAASGTLVAAIHGVASSALFTGIISASIGTIFSGVEVTKNSISWNWDKASQGFMWGAIMGTAAGGLSSIAVGIGSGLSYSLYKDTQMVINGFINGSLTALHGVITNNFDWVNVIISTLFGAIAGRLQFSSYGQGLRGIFSATGLQFSEEFIKKIYEIIEIYTQIKVKPTKIYL